MPSPTFTQAHVDAPVALQALELLLHPSFTAAVIQRAVLQNLHGCLALLISQHGVPVLAHQTLAHDTVTGAALRVLVTHLTGLHTVHPVLRPRHRQSRGTGHAEHQLI